MWNEPDPDPGGETSSAPSTMELTDLKDQNEQQKLMIAQLKQMLRKEQSSVTQEKVDEYINTLSKAKAKKSRPKKEEFGNTARGTSIDSNKKEKVNLLKRQLEENKAKLAERGKNQRGIEEMVTQLQAQLNDSQQFISLTPITITETKNFEYNKTSSQEELYNIQLIKERKINDMVEQLRKQEARIIDLQENLREKDSVIDARTKAITLMTDSLSKKGKDTLDALDDTKEQMRSMQENFVKLEGEMKARQLGLLNDLKQKKLEINELQDLNKQLQEENNELLKRNSNSENADKKLEDIIIKLQENLDDKDTIIEQKERQLKDTLDDLDRLKSIGMSVDSKCTTSDSEVVKLKKQLDDLNKNMIKVKAQSKSKIKDLTKKIESFKKMNDANALIIQLQTENTKLSEKIAELEEEKGNMQLKMVESSESVKDIITFEEYQSLNETLSKNKEGLEEKDKVISLLETDIVSLKQVINTLKDQVSGLTHLENAQVTSEMKSVQIEEQLDKVMETNASLRKELTKLEEEKKELNEKVEELIKEKHELSIKMENYIQENMELIDKLEKLSAEKVSSAESIEIVEGLTHQEKLELAAYQKTIDGPLKINQEDDNLNESVIQLNEDTTELLKKIDMFNAERKEVMCKMEELREENTRLVLKVNEIENNRDTLAETYEQLQTEKEHLQTENEKLLRICGKKSQDDHVTEASGEDTEFALQKLQKNYEKLLEENHALKFSLKELDSKIQEKHNLESELSNSRTKIDELECCIKTNLAEINNYQMIIEENKLQLIDSSNIINNLQTSLNEREKDVKDLNEIINDLNNIVSKLQNENEKLGDFEIMETQVNELKLALNKQIEQADDYSEEIAQNNDTIKNLNEKLIEMKVEIVEMEHDIEMKNVELSKRDETITNLQIQLDEKEKKINIVIDDMKQKYLVLQKQLDGNSGSLEKRIEEMSVKNKEQLEKMKKIAATLKKKNQSYQDLEEKYNEEKEKWEREANRKEMERVQNDETLLAEIRTLREDVAQKTKTLEECSIKIEELEQAKIGLQNSLLEAKHRHDKLNEVSLQQELSTSLHEEIVNPVQVNEEKLKELELIIETDEIELIHYKERVQVLEETVMTLTEERDQLRFQGSELERQLDVSTQNVEEKKLLEEQLGHKLEEVSANDEILTKRLEEATVENRELSQKTKEQEELITKLKVKLKKAHDRVTELKSLQISMDEIEVTNKGLNKQLEIAESNQRHTLEEYELLQKQYRQDYEKIECDYQAQMEELLDAKNSLTVECEKLNEKLKLMQEREEELIAELTENREKAEQLAVTDGHQIKELTEELKIATEKWKVAIDLTESLNQQLQEVQKQVVVQTAEEMVETILHRATEEVFVLNSIATQTENSEEITAFPAKIPSTIPTINWSGIQETSESSVQSCFTESQQQPICSWFDQNADRSIPVDNSKDLKEKIRALEFLLYNIDKEKEEVVKECTEMVNELTRLIYEKVNRSTMNVSSESHSTLASADLDLQIVQPEDIIDSSIKRKELRQIEFARCEPPCEQQSLPVVEEIIQPKQAYLTYQPIVEPFGENDDGWGWGPDDARLEEEHIKSSENVPQVRVLRAEIEQLHEKLRTVQAEGDNLRDEIKQWQIKAGKLSKKYKELRIKNDQLVAAMQTSGKKAEASDFFDIDAQIQEELKSQISQLEKKIKEVETDLEKEKTEKANILKRCDVLTAANDRMTDMKEIQDSEVLRWKRKYEDTEEKLNQQDWKTERFSGAYRNEQKQVECSETVEELQNTIKELSLDNEELQALLNEQRELRIDAEKSRHSSFNKELEIKTQHLKKELLIKSKEFEEIVKEKEQTIEDLKKTIEDKEKLLQEFSEKNHEIEQVLDKNLKEKIDFQMSEMKIELESIINEKDATLNEMKHTLDKTTALNDSLMLQIKDLNDDLVDLKCKYDKLQTDNLQNIQEISQRNTELECIEKQLRSELELRETNFNSLEKESSTKISNLEKELTNQLQAHETLQSENVMKIIELETKLSEQSHKYSETNIHLQSELQQQKQRYEEIQCENLQKIGDLEEELTAQKLNYDEIKFQLDVKVPQTCSEADKLSDLQNMVIEKDAELEGLKIKLDESNNQLAQIEQQLQNAQDQLVEKQKEHELMEVEMEEKLVKLREELELKWQEQVDERGNTVAESWKYHLSMVEAEFAAVQEKLRTEIDELETKCNALVNENNELRKNVDAEIRNEVDRVSALQQQINERQQTIQQLNKTLSELQKHNEILETQIHELQLKSESLEKQLSNKELEMSSLKLVVDTTQRQFEEKREVVEEIVKLLECNTSWPLSCEKGDILNEFQKQTQNYVTIIHEKENEVFKLREQLCQLEEKEYDFNVLNTQIADLQNQLDINREKENEIIRLHEQMSSLQEKEDEIARLSRVESDLQRMVFDLQTREEQEILRLNAVVDDYKMQLNENENKLLEMIKEKEDAYQVIEDLKNTIDSLQKSFINVSNLNQQFEERKNDSNIDLKMQISQLKEEAVAINQAMFDCQQQLSTKTNELEQVNNQLNYLKQNNDILRHELQKFNEILQSKDQELENYKQRNLKNVESLYEEKLSSKENDIEMLRAQLTTAAENITLLNEQLINENKIKTELEATVKQLEVKFNKQSVFLEEENKQLEDLTIIIEEQVAKIEELKQELFQKSNDYDSLIAQMDISRGAVTQQPKAGESQSPIPSSTQAEQQYTGRSPGEDDLSQLVCRAELDLALYMLHQRDVRCEELTVELTQLLEERDTLQLRLSNAIREKEEIRRKVAGEPDVAPSTSTTEVSTPRSKSSAIFLAASGTELATEPSEALTEDNNLASKLSELKRVGYKKDKTFVDEQELRRFQQMSIMQQHIHEASKLPPEAAAKLVDANYTLSRDVQSPSKVLLNWLWGRSIPKVNDT